MMHDHLTVFGHKFNSSHYKTCYMSSTIANPIRMASHNWGKLSIIKCVKESKSFNHAKIKTILANYAKKIILKHNEVFISGFPFFLSFVN